jgi:Uma2 family endonuclease
MNTALLPPPSITFRPSGHRLLTVADLAMMPTSLSSGDVRYELDDGRLIVLAPPAYGHSRRQNKIGRFLDTEAEERGFGKACAEVAIVLRRNPDRVVGADAAFILAASLPVRLSKEGYLETIPEIVVEVRSKNDSLNEVRAKKEEYFDAGVKLVWVLDPGDRTIAAYEPGQSVKTFGLADTLTTPLLPGFAVPVVKLFAE